MKIKGKMQFFSILTLLMIMFFSVSNSIISFAQEENVTYEFIEFIQNNNKNPNKKIKKTFKKDNNFLINEKVDSKPQTKKTITKEIEESLKQVESPDPQTAILNIEEEINKALIKAEEPPTLPQELEQEDLSEEIFSEEFGKRQVIDPVKKKYPKAWKDDILKIVQITDNHLDLKGQNLGPRMYKHSKELLEDAISQINELDQVDMVVFTGDMINHSSTENYKQFMKIANKLNVPWFPVLGNHDIGIRGGMSKSQFVNLTRSSNCFFRFNKPYYVLRPQKGYLVIVLDGVHDSAKTSKGYFPQSELEWLDEQLTKNEKERVIIALHYPIVEPFPSQTHRIINAGLLSSILNKHDNVLAVISGHYHGAKIQKVDNIVHVSTPSLVEYPNAFRVITVRDIEDSKVQIDFSFDETRLKDVQEKSKKCSRWIKRAEGDVKDRESYVIIEPAFKKKLTGLFHL